MRLVKDTSIERIFEEHGDDYAREVVNSEDANIAVFLIMVGYSAASFGVTTLQSLVAGKVDTLRLLITSFSLLIALLCGIGLVWGVWVVFWKRPGKAKKRVIHFVFDLEGKRLLVRHSEPGRDKEILPSNFPFFSTEMVAGRHEMVFTRRSQPLSVLVYHRKIAPDPVFILSLEEIGFQKVVLNPPLAKHTQLKPKNRPKVIISLLLAIFIILIMTTIFIMIVLSNVRGH